MMWKSQLLKWSSLNRGFPLFFMKHQHYKFFQRNCLIEWIQVNCFSFFSFDPVLADLRLQRTVVQGFKLELRKLATIDLKTLPLLPDWLDNAVLFLLPAAWVVIPVTAMRVLPLCFCQGEYQMVRNWKPLPLGSPSYCSCAGWAALRLLGSGASLTCKQIKILVMCSGRLCALVMCLGETPSCFRQLLWGSGRRPGLSGPPQPQSSLLRNPCCSSLAFASIIGSWFITEPSTLCCLEEGNRGWEKQQKITYMQMLKLT